MLGQREIERIWFGCGNFGGIGSSPKLAQRRRRRRPGAAAARPCPAGRPSPVRHRQHLRRRRERNHPRQVAPRAGRRLRPERADRDQGRQSAWLSAGRDAAQPVADRSHLDRSLRRLGVERIDLYYIHEFDRVTPLEETLERHDARASKPARSTASASPTPSLADVKAVRSLAGDSLAARFEYVQNEYNLLAPRMLRR